MDENLFLTFCPEPFALRLSNEDRSNEFLLK